MADRIKRYAVAEKAAQYADEIISFYAEVFRNQGEDTVVRMAAGKWLWEAAFGKPGQAVDTTPNQQPKQLLGFAGFRLTPTIAVARSICVRASDDEGDRRVLKGPGHT